MEAVQVYRAEFDSFENRNPVSSEIIGTFIAEGGRSALGVATDFISTLEPVNLYLGYDGIVYPRIITKEIKINE